MSTQYICTGGCGGAVSEEEFDGGTQSCGAESCQNHGQPFEKRIMCDACGGQSEEGEEHSCGM